MNRIVDTILSCYSYSFFRPSDTLGVHPWIQDIHRRYILVRYSLLYLTACSQVLSYGFEYFCTPNFKLVSYLRLFQLLYIHPFFTSVLYQYNSLLFVRFQHFSWKYLLILIILTNCYLSSLLSPLLKY